MKNTKAFYKAGLRPENQLRQDCGKMWGENITRGKIEANVRQKIYLRQLWGEKITRGIRLVCLICSYGPVRLKGKSIYLKFKFRLLNALVTMLATRWLTKDPIFNPHSTSYTYPILNTTPITWKWNRRIDLMNYWEVALVCSRVHTDFTAFMNIELQYCEYGVGRWSLTPAQCMSI